MRIVFFGTEEFSAAVLNGILETENEVVAVVSQEDKMNGRGNVVNFSAIKRVCIEKNIKILQYSSVSKEGEEDLKDLKPDLFITASFGQILKQNILDIPRYGTVNVHASLLPKYRGPAPIEGAIISGEKKTGITIMQTDAGLDTGDIFFAREMEIEQSDTADSCFKKLSVLASESIKEFLNNFNYYKTRHYKQDEKLATYFGKLKKEDALLSFNKSSFELVNLIRGRSTTSTCYTEVYGKRLKVLFASVVDSSLLEDIDKFNFGEVIIANPKSGLIVRTLDGAIRLNLVQLEGKKVMDDRSLLNGFRIEVGLNLNK